jgi:hypothetical protein
MGPRFEWDGASSALQTSDGDASNLRVSDDQPERPIIAPDRSPAP